MQKIFFLCFVVMFLFIGCSAENPLTTHHNAISANPFLSNSGIVGVYELTITVDPDEAELDQKRMPAIGESWTLSGKSFFDTFPCKDCFFINGLGYANEKLIIDFKISHPFPKGNPALPPTGRNRLDLDIFDLALLVIPEAENEVHYSLLDIDIYDDSVSDPDGFTTEVSMLTGNTCAVPFKMIIDDSESVPPLNTFNRFEMGTDMNFEVEFPILPGEILVFDLYLTAGYGASATFEDRLNPVYYNPEFNRKAAWKVAVIPPNGLDPPVQGNTWDDSDNSSEYSVTVKIFDWQIDANVDSNLNDPSDIYAASNVASIRVEIPGMINSPVQVEGDSYLPGGTGMPDSPLIYSIPIANENLLTAGEYIGLVEVNDERTPQYFSKGRDYLIHSPDGVTLNKYLIADYQTYQIFIATVVTGTQGNGNLIWAKSAGGMGMNEGNAVTALSDNSTVISGSFTESATFGKDEPNQTTLNSAGSSDIFVARYNPDGELAWAKRAGGTFYDECPGIASLSDDSTVVTGYFYSPTMTFGQGEPNQTTLINTSGELDIFIACYNPDGTLAWAKNDGGTADDCAYGIASLPDDSTVVTGFFYESATFGRGEPNQTILTSDGGDGWIDIFVARYNPDGTLVWAKSAGGPGDDEGFAVTALSDNSIVATGFFGYIYDDPATFGKGETNETVLTPNGGKDIFVAGYNPDGTLAWAKSAGGSNDDSALGITSLTDSFTVTTGYFNNSASFGPGETNETILNSFGANDIFIAKYNPDGTLAWAKHAGGTSNNDTSNGITSLSNNSTVVSGFYRDSATFGQGEINETTLTSAGELDIFIARYNPDGSLVWVNSAGSADWDKGYGITTLSDNSTVATGWFSESATFGPGEPNETVLTCPRYSDIFIARFQQ